jgi:hypothetical protein
MDKVEMAVIVSEEADENENSRHRGSTSRLIAKR